MEKKLSEIKQNLYNIFFIEAVNYLKMKVLPINRRSF